MILISPIPPLSLKDAIKRANAGENINIVTYEVLESEINRIAREAFSLLKPKDLSYITSAPSVLKEGQAALYLSGGVYKVFIQINGVIKSATFT